MPPIEAMQTALDDLISFFYGEGAPTRTGSPQAIADYDQMVVAICFLRSGIAAAKDAASRYQQH